MPKLIVLSPTRMISQVDLENILTLDGQIRRLQERRDELAAAILHRMADGYQIEDGARGADREVDYEGKSRRETLRVW